MPNVEPPDPRKRSWWWLCALVILHLLISWPGAGERGIIAEEVQPYLHRHPVVLDASPSARLLPPYDDPATLAALLEERAMPRRWVGTFQWPQLAYQGESRSWPVFVRGHQTALGSWWGVALEPVLGGGIAAVRRSSVLLGLVLLLLLAALADRCGLDPPWAALALGLALLSPGLWFFTRTGYGFELGSRVLMLAALAIAARPRPLDLRRGLALGLCVAAALLSRATIAVTLAPALILLLVHPRRWPGPARFVLPGVVGVGLPIVLVGLALATLPFWSGTGPAADLPPEALAGRTLGAPLVALVQLAWVVDPRVVLQPLVAGELDVPLTRAIVPALLGSIVLIAALLRWWRARSGDGERMFVAGLLGNSLFGAWLYGDPMQFQLAMALEPLFVLALAEQLRDLVTWARGRSRVHARLALAMLALVVVARSLTLASLWQAERRTNNPMLSGRAQQAVLAELERIDAPITVLTTDYNHAGVFEAWSGEHLHLLHGWPLLGSSDGDVERLRGQLGTILDSYQVCHVLLTVGPNIVAGEFSNNEALSEALERAVHERGREVIERREFESEAKQPALALWSLSGCE